jgi:RNA polymerase sigma factor (sigma-70 family)
MDALEKEVEASSLPGIKPDSGKDATFTATHWTQVFLARESASPQADAALASLCQRYWHPLYSYVRRLGHNAEDAQDLVQGFFAQLLEKNYLKNVDPAKGRFRTFLLIALKRYLANEWDRANRQKRGGGLQIVSFEAEQTELRYLNEPAGPTTPEKAFDRQWAESLLARVLDRLEADYTASGRTRTFSELRGFLTSDGGERSYVEVGRRLGVVEGNVRVAVHRLRQRYGTLLRKEIAETVASPQEVDEELRYLFSALG